MPQQLYEEIRYIFLVCWKIPRFDLIKYQKQNSCGILISKIYPRGLRSSFVHGPEQKTTDLEKKFLLKLTAICFFWKKSSCLFLQKQMATEFFQNHKWKINLPKRFKKSVSPWTSTNNYSLRSQSSARIQKYFCPIAKRHNFFYQTVINDCSSRILKQGPNSFEGLISGWLTLQSRTFQPQASTTTDFSTPDFQPWALQPSIMNLGLKCPDSEP